ncbi:MAG: hypothetical protein QNJ54_25570 [Prochloraceae cyanobacterium]|nr:hypothetical protein [Prochloraceae cyanobacterium]
MRRKHNLEARIREYIATNGGGITEVKTPAGKIDVVFYERQIIVEIKKVKQWKQAIGQLVCYRDATSNVRGYTSHLLLFGRPDIKPYLYSEVSKKTYRELQKQCSNLEINFEFFPKDTLIELAFPRNILLF